MMDIVNDIRSRIHDAPIPTEHLLDDAADLIERLTSWPNSFLTSSSAKITVNGDACPS